MGSPNPKFSRDRRHGVSRHKTPNSSDPFIYPDSTPLKKTRRQAALPLELGTLIMCYWRVDGQYHSAEIIERRRIKSHRDGDEGHPYEYYVHFTEFNRRHDEWVKFEQLDLVSLNKGVDKVVKGQETISKRTRSCRRKTDEVDVEDHDGLDPVRLREHEKATKVKNITYIELGRYEIDAWYYSPFPSEFDNSTVLYFCEFCLHYMTGKEQLQRHMRKCDLKHPPGNEIYRSDILSMFEVDGKKNRVYCQNLCLMAKLFLDHKTLVEEVEYFLFYVLCECDHRGCHIVAYFSKEKYSLQAYNLSCILTLPPYQKRGYGKFLIAFSYELSKKEGKVGTPEKPLSDLGKVSYQSYWTRVLLKILKKEDSEISVEELSKMTGITRSDVFCTLRDLNLIQYNEKGDKYICRDPDVLDFHLKSAGSEGPKIDVSKLLWTPYVEEEEEPNEEEKG